jgi:hypothetical protein
MAVSSCIRCGGTVFEVVDAEPKDSKFKLEFVQCASCGGVVGVMEDVNIGSYLRKLARELNIDLDRR